MLSGISSLGFSSCFGMVMFFSEILGVLSALGTTCSTFTFGGLGVSCTTVAVGAITIGVSTTGMVVFSAGAAVIAESVGVDVTPLLFFLKGQPQWTKRP
jgi:hypothetical protein